MQLPSLPSLASLPALLPSLPVPAFIKSRQNTLAYVAGTVTGVYFVAKWGFRQLGEMAERSMKTGRENEDLTRRFNLNKSDSTFTILALLPSLSSAIFADMDVEALSAELAREAAKREAAKVVIEAAIVVELVEEVVEQLEVNNDPPEEGLLEASVASISELAEEVVPRSPVLGLNPAAAAFVPSWGAPAPEVVQPAVEAPLSKSWAQIVVNGNGQAQEEVKVEEAVVPAVEDAATPVETVESPADPINEFTSEGVQLGESPVSEPPATRAELWHSLKILSFTRTLTTLYVLVLLTLQTHVQLSLIGRSHYVASVLSTLPPASPIVTDTPLLDAQAEDDDDFEKAMYAAKGGHAPVEAAAGAQEREKVEREYLTMSWWLLNVGWKEVGERVEAAVKEVLGPMSLKAPLGFADLSTTLSQIRHKVEFLPNGLAHSFTASLFPPTPTAEIETLIAGGLPAPHYISPALRHLLNETSDFLSCNDATLVRGLLLDKVFSQLLGGLEGTFLGRSTDVVVVEGEQGSRFEEVVEKTVRLASLFPKVARQSHLVLNGSPNEYVEAMEDVRELDEFCAIIYGSYERDNARSFG